MSTIREEKSAGFLILKATLSPLILLANMASHTLQQAFSFNAYRKEAQNQTESRPEPTTDQSSIAKENLTGHNLEGLDLMSQHINLEGLPMHHEPHNNFSWAGAKNWEGVHLHHDPLW